jgi:effector-binding domain-containing protein
MSLIQIKGHTIMTTKELILSEIDVLNEEQLEALYAVIQQFLQVTDKKETAPLLTQLSQIRIDGPEDFSTNLDMYLSGEKQIDSTVH